MRTNSQVIATLGALLALSAGSRAQPTRHNVVLVTLDGARVEEMFSGLDLDVLRSTLGEKEQARDSPVYKKFWADTAVTRRERLMPFFWGTLMRAHGSIAGNRQRDSVVRLVSCNRK